MAKLLKSTAGNVSPVGRTRRKVHFVGVGGIGMSGLAEILLNLGHAVSGSDLAASPITTRLVQLGLEFHHGHDPDHVGDAEIVVRSAAVTSDNVELVAAHTRRVPVIERSELLADLVRLKPNAVVVAGSHGKTTVTSMISAILDWADIGATSIIGGILHRSGTNARWGTGEYLVAEADEHDGSFLRLRPTIGVVTNVDAEHLEYYGTVETLKKAFTDFCNGIPFYGYAIVCADDPVTKEMAEEIDSVCITYGMAPDASVGGSRITLAPLDPKLSRVEQVRHIRTQIDIENRDEILGEPGKLGSLEINALGEHNARNALAATAVGLCLGMPFETVAKGVASFDGVQRRLQPRGESAGVLVVEDYAHHPTEIRHTIAAMRLLNPTRLICVFQPHLFSRTKYFCHEFGTELSKADRTFVTDIYPSREQPMAGVDAGKIVEGAREQGASHVDLVRDWKEIPSHVADVAQPGDIVLVLGAGDINRVVEPLLSALEEGHGGET